MFHQRFGTKNFKMIWTEELKKELTTQQLLLVSELNSWQLWKKGIAHTSFIVTDLIHPTLLDQTKVPPKFTRLIYSATYCSLPNTIFRIEFKALVLNNFCEISRTRYLSQCSPTHSSKRYLAGSCITYFLFKRVLLSALHNSMLTICMSF